MIDDEQGSGWDDGSEAEASLLSELSDATRQNVLVAATPLRLRAGEWLFRRGDASDAMFIVRSGRVEVLDGPGHGAPGGMLRVVGPGAVLGEIGLLTGLARSASVRARRDSFLLRVDADVFAGLLRHSPGLALALSRAMGLRLASSRNGETADIPLVKVVTLSPIGGGLPMRVITSAMLLALRELQPPLRAAVIDENQARAAAASSRLHDNASTADITDSFVAELDRLERSHDVLLLVTGAITSGDDLSRAWTDLCLRSADRNILFVSPGDRVGGAAAAIDRVRFLLPGRLDVCFLDAPDPAGLGAWLDALEPRGHHVVQLDASEAVSETVGRMTRRVVGRSVGVVLSGGGARGLSHLGVLAAFRAADVKIDRVGGCSMGAIMGALFAAGHSPDDLMRIAQRYFIRDRPLNDYTVPRVALLRGSKMAASLREALGPDLIETLPRPFFCVSADLVRAEPVVHRRGRLWSAVLASASIPGLLPPRPEEGRLLVDGGVLNNLPIDVMADDAEGPVVAVDVMRPFGRGSAEGPRSRRRRLSRRRDAAGDPEPPLPPIAEVLARTMVLGSWQAAERNRRRAAVTITVPDDGTGLFAWDRLDALVTAGRAAAEEALQGPASWLLPSAGSAAHGAS